MITSRPPRRQCTVQCFCFFILYTDAHFTNNNKLFERNKSGAVGGTNTWTSVLYRLVCYTELSEVVSNHLRLSNTQYYYTEIELALISVLPMSFSIKNLIVGKSKIVQQVHTINTPIQSYLSKGTFKSVFPMERSILHTGTPDPKFTVLIMQLISKSLIQQSLVSKNC